MITRLLSAFLCGFSCCSAFSAVVINEIHYDPVPKTEFVEFIELYNTSASAVDVSNWAFTQGIGFTFPQGTSIAPGGYLVVAENPSALKTKYGANALGPWIGNLDAQGETITLADASGNTVDKVDYQLGFPWPTVGEAPGYSIELINPNFDNDLGGNWRRSAGTGQSQSLTLIPTASTWNYKKGNEAPSTPVTAWRDLNFSDASWSSGALPIGYDPSVPLGTPLSDMSGNYFSIFVRKTFVVDDPASVGALRLEAMYDDGFKAWINGVSVWNQDMPAGEVAYNSFSTGAAREDASYLPFNLPSPSGYLVKGTNVICVEVHNVNSGSSDCFFDGRLIAMPLNSGDGPTPGARNVCFAANAPPAIRQVDHSPQQPKSGEPVIITAKVTDPDGVSSVYLEYQVVQPGNYIELNDAAYQTGWVRLDMTDDGTNGDAFAGDSLYTATVPASVQAHRTLVRYRISAVDSLQKSIRVPYSDDHCPNFAYFVYNGVPSYEGAISPGSADATMRQVVTVSSNEMSRLPVYHLIAKKTSVETATWYEKYTGDLYKWWGTLVYDGKVYDHVRYRARGGVWRYAMGKNMWKFDFNRGHDFQPRDNYGHKYSVGWKKLNFGANIQQGDYWHRGEQGMFESVGFRLFNLAGVDAPRTHWAEYRIIDAAAEKTSQYNSDFWGLYLAVEQEDGRFLDEHNLPDGNLYKIEGYAGTLNNLGRAGPADGSDINAFMSGYRNSPTESWWRSNFDLNQYYSYQSIVQAIHHYDICDGKNYFYYHDPISRKWSVHTWDIDLTWANNMYRDCAGADDLKNRVLATSALSTEFKNRVREVRDLLWNTDQAYQLLDEYAGIVKGVNSAPNILDADRMMWDYNPVMVNSAIVYTSKASQGYFYQFPVESASDPTLKGSFNAGVKIMKNYVITRSTLLDSLAADSLIPAKPTLVSSGPSNFPSNKLRFKVSNYSGSGTFAAVKFRIGEISTNTIYGVPNHYEIESVWDSGELSTVPQEVAVPAGVAKVGHTYRARARYKDANGRWSNWSAPVQFVAVEADNATALVDNLVISELMYNPPGNTDFEFVELYNTSPDVTLQLDGVKFTEGIDYTFPVGSSLPPQSYALVVKTAATSDFSTFRAYYNVPTARIFGPYSGGLNNDGERLTLKTSSGGAEIFSFAYNDRSGWPISPDGAGHSLVPINVGIKGSALSYGGNWRASSYIKGSPGASDPIRPAGPVLNEITAHTDYSDPARPEYDSNDWIELYNPTAQAFDLSNYYLSDDAANLKKWAIPAQSLQAKTWLAFDEISGFHNPITTGFGINKAGEEIYLSYLPGTAQDRVVDSVRFKGQENGASLGRMPDGGGYFVTTAPTRGKANAAKSPELVISELMYNPFKPVGDTNDFSWREFIEIYNPSSSAVTLQNTNGTWRVDGGVKYAFPANTTIPAKGVLLLVTFDPTVSGDLTRFKDFYGIQNTSPILGPIQGKMENDSDRVAIEKPQAPDLVGDAVSWINVDEVIYADLPSWPDADGTGKSIQRVVLINGNDPTHWMASGTAPDPGVVKNQSADQDSDSDGMPDSWELAHGLNPFSAADANEDADGDGATNLAEYLAGTDPQNKNSSLRLGITMTSGSSKLVMRAMANKAYVVEYTNSLTSPTWTAIQHISPSSVERDVEVTDSTAGQQERFYRVKLL